MADLYQPTTHADGELWNAVKANKVETGLEALDNELDAQTDRIDALYASGGAGGGQGQILSGPSSTRPSPAIGLLYYDTGLSPARVIIGTGSGWTNTDGSAITTGGGGPAPGTTTAPVLSHTVTSGGSIGAINLTWTAVSGATSYKVYETESPDGVSGATALTTTSSTRTPSTARNYRYWVTATVGGVESASSNVIEATLPYVAGGGGGTPTGTDPSTFLNINGKGNGTGGWWNLGIGFSTGHTDITPTQLQNGYVNSPYFTMNSTGTAVQGQVFMNGGRTGVTASNPNGGTKYPRTEFREMATGSTTTKAAWSGSSGRHILRGKSRVIHMAPEKPEVVVAQMHDSEDDTLQIHVTGSSASGPQTWRLKVNGSTVATLIDNVALGAEVAWDIDVNNGNLTVKINNTTRYTGSPGWGSGQYFKCLTYAQQNSTDQSNSSTEYSRTELRDLYCAHS